MKLIAAASGWLDQCSPQLYVAVAVGVIVFSLGVALVTLWRESAQAEQSPDWRWAGLIVLILLAGRWPTFLVNREFNPDESQLLAGAHTLVHDPVFWRSVDGGSSGPLNFFALWPAAGLCGWQWQGYLPARLTAFGLLAGTFILVSEILVLLVGRRVARLAVLPALCLEALTSSLDLLHYSTELLPMLQLTVTVYAAVRRWRPGGAAGWNALGGLALGAVAFTKVQVAPLAGLMGLAWLTAELLPAQRGRFGAARRVACLVGAALLPAAFFALQLAFTGELPGMIATYITWNLHYPSGGQASYVRLFKLTLYNSVEQRSLLHLWLAWTAATVAVLWWFGRAAEPRLKAITRAMAIGCVIALFCIIFPRRPFLHYWQLLVVPATLLGGVLAGRVLALPLGRLPRMLVAASFCATLGVLVGERVRQPSYMVKGLAYFHANPNSEIAQHVARYARPGDSVAVWGWTNCIYVEAGLRQATRDPMVERLIEPGPFRDFYRRRYLRDFVQSAPPIFVDSIGKLSLHYQASIFAHENMFPEFAALIRVHYLQVDQLDGARIYLRRDLMAGRGAPPGGAGRAEEFPAAGLCDRAGRVHGRRLRDRGAGSRAVGAALRRDPNETPYGHRVVKPNIQGKCRWDIRYS